MHVRSLLPFVGLSLITFAAADDNSTDLLALYGIVSGAPSKRGLIPSVRRSTPLQRRSAAICEDLPSRWSYSGCYADDPSNRALTGPSYCDDTGLAEEKCIEFCDAKGYSVAGVEFGSECYCGYSLGSSGTKAAELDCNMPCAGNPDELCGAGNRLNVFTNGDSAPTEVAQSGDYTSLGCYSDSASARTLTTRMSLSGNVRVSDCTSACKNAGFNYAGLEFGNECYCGSSIQNGGAPIASSSCSMACSATKSELCGGPGAINIYHSSAPAAVAGAIPSGWTNKKCYTDDVSHRTLANKISLDSLTVEGCINACQGAGFSLAGLEFGSECFCGNTIDNGATSAADGCSMACNGNTAETCGGPGRLNLYSNKPDATCAKHAGCIWGTSVITTKFGGSLQDCKSACVKAGNCLDYMYFTNIFGTLVCNLSKDPINVAQAGGGGFCDIPAWYEVGCEV